MASTDEKKDGYRSGLKFFFDIKNGRREVGRGLNEGMTELLVSRTLNQYHSTSYPFEFNCARVLDAIFERKLTEAYFTGKRVDCPKEFHIVVACLDKYTAGFKVTETNTFTLSDEAVQQVMKMQNLIFDMFENWDKKDIVKLNELEKILLNNYHLTIENLDAWRKTVLELVDSNELDRFSKRIKSLKRKLEKSGKE